MSSDERQSETTAGDRGQRDDRGRFRSGNPGRPRGSRHAALVALDHIGEEGAEDVMRAVLDAARGGDMRAADILLRRLWPERKGRPVQFDLPPLVTAADGAQATGAVAAAVASGHLSPEEGQAVAAIVEAHRRAVETVELAERLAQLEQAMERRSGKDGGA